MYSVKKKKIKYEKKQKTEENTRPISVPKFHENYTILYA